MENPIEYENKKRYRRKRVLSEKSISAFLYSNLHEFSDYGAESKNWADIHVHCDEQYNMAIDAVCSKSAGCMVDQVSSVLAETLLKGS